MSALDTPTAQAIIRPFAADGDYPALVAIHNAVWGEPELTVKERQSEDEEFPSGYLRQQFLAEVKGQPVAYASYSETPWAYEPHKYFITGGVLPAFQRRGIGAALYQHIFADLQTRGARLLTTTSREDLSDALRFLARRSFEPTIREPESRLDLTAFDSAQFASVAERVAAAGVRLYSLAELKQRDADWERRCWELHWQIMEDVPTSETFTRQPFGAFQKQLAERPLALKAGFVAVDTRTGEYVGLTSVEPTDDDPALWNTGLTGVVRSHRQRGLALALKVRAIAFAQSRGAEVLITDNEEHNPMYHLNHKLGFRHYQTWIGFEKRLTQGGHDE